MPMRSLAGCITNTFLRRTALDLNFCGSHGAGVLWRGGLLYPPHFDATKRYPLVIQTYGFKPGVFIIDHQARGSSAFAAQAFANEGMLVLLLPEPAVDSQSREWFTAHQQGIEAAIDRLDALALIDRTKVGIIGFSATGNPVQHMLTFSDYDIAAAWGISLSAYASMFGHPAPAMLSDEDMMQAHPWGDGLALWTQRDPSLHVDRVRAALRIETYGPVSDYWDTYVLMRRQHKPADLIVFPNGWHQLRNPRQRLDSLQGNVDWFSFWLQGREDPDPIKEDQYRRWRGLRSERNALINPPAAD
jgi:dienelactone hydrolase